MKKCAKLVISKNFTGDFIATLLLHAGRYSGHYTLQQVVWDFSTLPNKQM